ncbi:hypothetical protein FA13DRAFT_1735547 [Coprinellus micaceus]|uniref:Uncharacterized protein n=1 Tax=Coprinellus micaceus TaxID=71717 RepID=A0A4Y7T3G8_COPMI|nr:hypothetical protein FA13DRAFT_1735547 [Coprinellus micaceus]
MALKSKHGGGLPEWRRQIEGPPPMGMEEPPMPPPPPMIEDVPQARPGWRPIHKKTERRARRAIAAPPAPAPPPQAAPSPPPGMGGPFDPHGHHHPGPSSMPAWAQWRRTNPLLAPTPLMAPSRTPATPPPRPGLFGATTPPPGGR